MRVVRRSETRREPLVDGDFSGPVTKEDLGRLEGHDSGAIVVTFRDGARTGWHRHAGGQVLFVLDGHGRAGVRDGTIVELKPGDLVEAAPGEEHWHGAQGGATMSHLSLAFGQTDWFGLVEE